MIHETGADHVRLLTLEYDGGSNFYQDTVIFRENSHEIVKILADKNKLYVMSKAGDAYRFKCFDLEKQSLYLSGSIDNVEREYPLFIDEFMKSFQINSNILIVNEDKLIKIYDNSDSEQTG